MVTFLLVVIKKPQYCLICKRPNVWWQLQVHKSPGLVVVSQQFGCMGHVPATSITHTNKWLRSGRSWTQQLHPSDNFRAVESFSTFRVLHFLLTPQDMIWDTNVGFSTLYEACCKVLAKSWCRLWY